MKHIFQLISVVALATGLGACGKQEDRQALEPMPAEQPQEAVSQAKPVAQPPTPQYADSLSRTMATDKFNTQSGEVVDGKLKNNGKPGYLLFGPYAPFKAGDYTLSIKGSVDALEGGKVHLDVASGKGRVLHGGEDVVATGDLPSFDVNIASDVSDLEVRLLAPPGSKVSIESYQLNRKD